MLRSFKEMNHEERKEQEIKKGCSIYLRIAMNYFQVNAIIATLNIQWPYDVQQYLSVFLPIFDFSGQILSYECILLDMQINYKSIYIHTTFSMVLPFLISLYIFIHYIFKKIFIGNAKLERVFVAVMVTHVFTQPMILKQLLENFNCVQIDSETYLASQMDLKCDDSNFQTWVN